MLFKSLTTLISFAAVVSAQATLEELALVDAQWVQSGLANTSDGGFFPLSSKALLKVNYYNSSVGVVQNGQSYAREDVQTAPLISVQTPDNSTTDFTSLYTIICADPGSIGDPNPNGSFRHALTNGAVAMNVDTRNNFTVNLTSGTVIGNYVGPAPPPGSGAHRYVWMLFLQNGLFKTPASLSQPYTAPSRFNVTQYVNEAGGDGGLTLIAATFFLVENPNGTATGPVITTTPLNTASLSSTASSATSGAAMTTSMGGSMSASSAAPTTTSRSATAAPAATTTPASGAIKAVAATSVLSVIVAFLGLFAVM